MLFGLLQTVAGFCCVPSLKQHPLTSLDVVFLSRREMGGGDANLFVSIVFFGRHMARPVRRCKMQIQGSLTLNEAVTVTGALLKSTHHSTQGRNSRGDPQCRAALSFSLLLPSLSAPPTSFLQYNGIHHTRDQRYCMHAALICRLIPHHAFFKGRLAIVSKSSSQNIILVLPAFTVSFCFFISRVLLC